MQAPYFDLRLGLRTGDSINHWLASNIQIMSVCGAIWFYFEHKNHSNYKIKMHTVRFSLVGF
jgi:hypothetical protein